MEPLVVAEEDPRTEDVRALLDRHLAFAKVHSPPEDVHALDLKGLLDPRITFLVARRDGVLLGTGALKVDGDQGEIKSMHTLQEARGQGVARGLLDRLLAVARERGCARVSLETGSMDAFAPARALYESVGFVECPPFGAYRPSGYSTFMTLALDDDAATPPDARTAGSPTNG